MQPCKHKIALLIGALILGASGTANAASEPFVIKAKALPDVAITTVRPLNYNTSIFIDAGGSCLMDATIPGDAPAALMQYDGAGDTASGYGDLSGSGCVNGAGKGIPGIYKIKGLSGATVNITINNSVAGGDVEFSPNSGCIVNYDGATTADTCDSFIPGTSTSKKLAVANASESPVTGGTGTTTAGELMFTVGGTLTVNNLLTPDFTGSIDYNVEVVY